MNFRCCCCCRSQSLFSVCLIYRCWRLCMSGFFSIVDIIFVKKKNILLAGVARKIYQLWKITGKINNSTGTERNYSEIAQQKWDTYIFGWFFGLFFFSFRHVHIHTSYVLCDKMAQAVKQMLNLFIYMSDKCRKKNVTHQPTETSAKKETQAHIQRNDETNCYL